MAKEEIITEIDIVIDALVETEIAITIVESAQTKTQDGMAIMETTTMDKIIIGAIPDTLIVIVAIVEIGSVVTLA